jgi:class 3 adenylate cyclase
VNLSGAGIALIAVLGGLVVVFVTLFVIVALRLRGARLREIALETELEAARAEGPPGRPSGSALRAERAIKRVVETAVKVREQGFGGLMLESIDELSRSAMQDRDEITRMAAKDGTVTIFFSDIEGSTALNAELGDDAWVRLLIVHDTQVRAHVDRRGGHIVKSQGDGFMVVFTSGADAVKAGLGIQRSLANQRLKGMKRAPLKVRIGIHEGPAIARAGDLFGQTVAVAARVADHAAGAQILVTEPVADSLAEDARFRLSAEEPVELRGIPGTHPLWRVERGGRR